MLLISKQIKIVFILENNKYNFTKKTNYYNKYYKFDKDNNVIEVDSDVVGKMNEKDTNKLLEILNNERSYYKK